LTTKRPRYDPSSAALWQAETANHKKIAEITLLPLYAEEGLRALIGHRHRAAGQAGN
jgi:hypothetical protein